MADKYRYRWGPKILRWITKSATVAIELGDMLQLSKSTGKVQAVSAAGNSTSLIGVALSKSPATDPTATYIRVALVGQGTVFEMIVGSSTYTYGDCFTIGGAQTLAEASMDHLDDTATNVVATAVEDLATAGTALLVEFLAPAQINKVIVNS